MKARLFYCFLWLSAIAFALTGCAGTKNIVVEKPIPVTCQTPTPPEPVYPVIAKDDGLFVRVQKLLETNLLKTGYIVQLKAWGEGCHT